jgi:sugar phosphate isomerase/epimerase
MDRKQFIQSSTLLASTLFMGFNSDESNNLNLSLSQWSLHRALFGNSKEDYGQWQKWLHAGSDAVIKGTLDPLDFPKLAKDQFGFDAVEYVNTFFFRRNEEYFTELNKRSDDAGIKNLLIMVDEEGFLGDPEKKERLQVVERHKKWLETAAILGCHSIRVNAHSIGDKAEQMKLVADGLSQLCDVAEKYNLEILIENHGGMSSEPNWLIDTIKAADRQNIGTMVDFDNFSYSETKIWNGEHTYDRYDGVALLMPFAKSVSAKSYAFNAQGKETKIDFAKMMEIVKNSGFEGYISVEYEGPNLSESNGIMASKKLLQELI